MMWPILTKVHYEALPTLLPTRHTLTHVLLSLLLNWVFAPFLMLALAWAALPDLPTYRTGVIMVGLARCIAMVMVWNALARGDGEYCAILVVLNSLLQIVLYAPLALLFVNVLGGGGGTEETLHVSYGDVAISVLIYLGIPLAAGIATRFAMLRLTSRRFFEEKFLPYFGPLALLGLLYTIVVMFAYQGHHIVHNLGPVFRVFVPLVLYFVIMWSAAFALVWWCARRAGRARDKENTSELEPRTEQDVEGGRVTRHSSFPEGARKAEWSYEMAVVQSFTAASNNFVSTFPWLCAGAACVLFVFPGACDSGHDRSLWSRVRPGPRRDYWTTRGGSCPTWSHMGRPLVASAVEMDVSYRGGGGEHGRHGDQATRSANGGHGVDWCGRGRIVGDECRE
ncbi:transporter [Ganoderma sinense ZZ0214-1]|uniref:Transporter n=1 Tax=Ganoderma sinense ZZ0214-1 TaxID=1077348 RepID=A0A2G8SRF5_9APHY|nr:transporter [Ganoderma sinense ZZ0214-1]